jgi:hypothetical protein
MKHSYHTLVIGTGCAGYNAADKLFDLGIRDIAVITEGRFIGNSRNSGSDKQFYYKLPSKALYRNTLYNNTFIFETPSKRISVFYQPVIFGQSYSSDLMENNSIGLYRNTTLRFPSVYTDAEDKGGKFSYYAPDYIIKIEKSTACEYIILDAKYSDIAVVKNHYFAALEYKYLFSINTEKLEDKIIGLYALCGKYNINDEFIDIYDIARQLGYSNNKPEAKLIPLFESETCVGYQQIIKHLQ